MSFAQIICADGEYGESEPWEHGVLGKYIPQITPVRIEEHTARHCFSVCLYHEPEFAERFPLRTVQGRYIERALAAKERLKQHGCSVNIICDKASLQDALDLNMGSVFLCHDEPKQPFGKHLLRYYSPLLMPHPTVEFYHFRGMDNILSSEEEMPLLNEFARSGCDILRSPYSPLKYKLKQYIKVRGSCSVNLRGGMALSHFLTSVPLAKQRWPLSFHCDELHLNAWMERYSSKLKQFILIDRRQNRAFYEEMQTLIEDGVEGIIKLKIGKGGPMTSSP